MEIHQLRYFVAVAQEGSFSRAAAKVRVAQPSLSQQIQKLEMTLGQRLFDRLTRRVVLTEAGYGLLPFAHRILNELGSAQRWVGDRGKTPTGNVKLGVLPTIAPFIVRRLVGAVRRELKKVELTIVEDVTDQLVQLIDNGEVDLAIISTCRTMPGMHLEPLAEEHLAAALPEQHLLASRTEVAWRDLKGESVLLLHESHCLSGQIQKWCGQHRTRHTRAGVLQLGTLLEMVAAGSGISLVPTMAAEQSVRGVIIRPFKGVVPSREINLLRNGSRYQSKAALAVAEISAAVVRDEVEGRKRNLSG